MSEQRTVGKFEDLVIDGRSHNPTQLVFDELKSLGLPDDATEDQVKAFIVKAKQGGQLSRFSRAQLAKEGL